LINKSDLLAGSDGQEARHYAASHDVPVIGASMTAGQESGINEFLLQRVVQDLGGTDFPAATRARHGELLRDARFHLRRAIGAITTPELAAEDVRLAARALARVTGRVGVEDVLDRVFATFCIGK
jgi:tRNA modification GTPase